METPPTPDIYHNAFLPWLIDVETASGRERARPSWPWSSQQRHPPLVWPLAIWLKLRMVSKRTRAAFGRFIYPMWCKWARERVMDRLSIDERDAFATRGDCVMGVTVAYLVHGKVPYFIGIMGTGDSPYGGTQRHLQAIWTGPVTTIEYWDTAHMDCRAVVGMFDFASYRGLFDGTRLYLADWEAVTGPITLTQRDVDSCKELFSTIIGGRYPYLVSERVVIYNRHGLGELTVDPELQ